MSCLRRPQRLVKFRLVSGKDPNIYLPSANPEERQGGFAVRSLPTQEILMRNSIQPARRIIVKLRNRAPIWLFAVLLALAGPSSVSSRTQTGWHPSAGGADTSPAFVLYQDERGDIACRQATRAEHQRISERGNGGPTRVIYEGAPLRSQMLYGATWTPDPMSGLLLQPSAGLRIVLHGTTQLAQNQQAKNAFIVAANHWESIITTPITVVIDVDYGTTFFGQPYPSAGILGATGLDAVQGPFSDLRQRLINTASTVEQQLYNALPASAIPVEFGGVNSDVTSVELAVANARALGIVPDIADPNSVTLGNGDAGIGFNSAFVFDLNPDDGVSSGQTDFDTVATHEIGHALGFVSDSGDTTASPVAIWDLFRFQARTVSLANFATTPRVMSKGGEQIFFANQTNTFGTLELALSTGGPNPGPNDGDGRQSSHWKDDALLSTRPYIGIMDPTLARGLHRTISENDIVALDLFGYSMAGLPLVRPPNDNFANALALLTDSGSLTGTNVNGTHELGETAHVGYMGDKSVWYTWVSPVNGQATFDTIGSNFDTTLAVYIGPFVNQVLNVAQNDDIVAGTNKASRVQFNVTAGTTYRVVVDGWNGEYGNVTLNWTSSGSVPTPTPTPTPTPSPSPTPTPQAAIVTGRVLEAATPLSGVLVGLWQNGVVLQTMTTGADGRWTFSGAVVGQFYNTLFAKPGYAFSPPSLIYSMTQVNQDMGDVSANKVNGNPIDASDFFVTQHYNDFLSRAPDSSGLAFWINNIETCFLINLCREVKRIDTSSAFFLSIEFQQTGYLVERIYKASFGDAIGTSTFPSPHQVSAPIVRFSEFLADSQTIGQGVVVGQGNWQQQLETNKQAFTLEFVQRTRFTTAFPTSLTPIQFVDLMFANAGVTPSSADRTSAINEFGGAGTSADVAARSRALRAVAENATLNQQEFNRAFVLMQYFGYLRRNPNDTPDSDYTGYDFWLTKLNSFTQPGDDAMVRVQKADMVKAFIVSTEYRHRFGT